MTKMGEQTVAILARKNWEVVTVRPGKKVGGPK